MILAAETPETPQNQSEQQAPQWPQENHPQGPNGQQAYEKRPQGNFQQQPNQQMPHPPFDPEETRQLKSAQTLTTVAGIGGPASIFIGGTFLSAVATVCGIVAIVKYQKLINKGGNAAPLARRMRIAAAVACGVSCLAFIMNLITIIMVWPVLMEFIETGDISAILQGSESASDASGSSTWG